MAAWLSPLAQPPFSPEQSVPQTPRTCVGMLHCDSSIWTSHTEPAPNDHRAGIPLKDPGRCSLIERWPVLTPLPLIMDFSSLIFETYLGQIYSRLSVWSSSLNGTRQDISLRCACVGGMGVWLRYGTGALVLARCQMSVLVFAGPLSSLLGGFLWAPQLPVCFHYLWLCQSDIRSLHLCYSAH